MRNALSLVLPLALSLSACGSNPETPGSGKPSGAAEGYTRFVAQTVTGIQPGGDVTHCQYVMAPVDHDMDVLDVQGAQSQFGHHGVAFSYTPGDDDVVGSEVPCMMGSNEFSATAASGSDAPAKAGVSGGYLGSVGGVGALPQGVAYRLKKGQGIVLNLHYINTSAAPVNGDAYLDVKIAEVDPIRQIAAMFLNLNGGFSLPPKAQTDSSVDCTAKSDVNLIMFGNHMHEYGIHATTEVVRGDTGAVEVLRDDPTWGSDMVSNAPLTRWDATSPFALHAGDTIRTSCSWTNSTADAISFPREMCIGTGFALATSDNPTAPTCFNGNWQASGPGTAP